MCQLVFYKLQESNQTSNNFNYRMSRGNNEDNMQDFSSDQDLEVGTRKADTDYHDTKSNLDLL